MRALRIEIEKPWGLCTDFYHERVKRDLGLDESTFEGWRRDEDGTIVSEVRTCRRCGAALELPAVGVCR